MPQTFNINTHLTSHTFQRLKPTKIIALGLQNMHEQLNIGTTFGLQNLTNTNLNLKNKGYLEDGHYDQEHKQYVHQGEEGRQGE